MSLTSLPVREVRDTWREIRRVQGSGHAFSGPLKDQNQEKFLLGNLGTMGVYRRESRSHAEICSLFFSAMPTSRDTAGDYGRRKDYGRREPRRRAGK